MQLNWGDFRVTVQSRRDLAVAEAGTTTQVAAAVRTRCTYFPDRR